MQRKIWCDAASEPTIIPSCPIPMIRITATRPTVIRAKVTLLKVIRASWLANFSIYGRIN
ncbi:MAG: hypothetical protein HOH65_13765 [Rhodospirillaceae bacterium]|nr:hypothetical protein [Rhodospirillaceae bacterium]